jgi:hypothetical protein
MIKKMAEDLFDSKSKVNIYDDFEVTEEVAGKLSPDIILPLIRRVMPTIIANEIIGVQPMTGPVGQIHTLRVKYGNEPKDTI